jgi:hypothetical protein
MISIRQKTPDYCFVACVASALLDEGYNKLQDLIVERFAAELKEPAVKKTGVPTWPGTEKILKELALAVKVHFDQRPIEDAIKFLKSERKMAQWIFINTNRQGYHVVRLSEVRDDGITVMDPTDGTMKNWSWQDFRKEYYALVIRNWE